MVIREILEDTGGLILQVTRIDSMFGMTWIQELLRILGRYHFMIYRMHELVASPLQVKFKKIEKKKKGMLKGIYFEQQTDVFNKISDSFESPEQEGQWVNPLTSPPIHRIHSPSTTTWFSGPIVIPDLAQWWFFPQDSQSTVLGLLILSTESFWSQLNSLIFMDVSVDSDFSMIYLYMVQRVKICVEMSLVGKEKIQLGVYTGWTWVNRGSIEVHGIKRVWRKNINFT